jgi:hypothetical protein
LVADNGLTTSMGEVRVERFELPTKVIWRVRPAPEVRRTPSGGPEGARAEPE